MAVYGSLFRAVTDSTTGPWGLISDTPAVRQLRQEIRSRLLAHHSSLYVDYLPYFFAGIPLDEESVVIGLCGNHHTAEKLISNLTEVHSRGGAIIALSPQDLTGLDGIADDVIHLPHLSDPLSPIPYSVATQLLAYHIAKTLHREIDQPRNLAKSVTVE